MPLFFYKRAIWAKNTFKEAKRIVLFAGFEPGPHSFHTSWDIGGLQHSPRGPEPGPLPACMQHSFPLKRHLQPPTSNLLLLLLVSHLSGLISFPLPPPPLNLLHLPITTLLLPLFFSHLSIDLVNSLISSAANLDLGKFGWTIWEVLATSGLPIKELCISDQNTQVMGSLGWKEGARLTCSNFHCRSMIRMSSRKVTASWHSL